MEEKNNKCWKKEKGGGENLVAKERLELRIDVILLGLSLPSTSSG